MLSVQAYFFLLLCPLFPYPLFFFYFFFINQYINFITRNKYILIKKEKKIVAGIRVLRQNNLSPPPHTPQLVEVYGGEKEARARKKN
jgi:hypothetical protein